MLSLRKCMVAGAVAAFFTTAGAQQQNPCRDDVDKFCKDVQPGEGKILECMNSHQADLSPKCASYMKQMKAQMKNVADACKADVEKFCWDTPMGKGGVASCLKQHSADLSADCKIAVAKAKGAAKH